MCSTYKEGEFKVFFYRPQDSKADSNQPNPFCSQIGFLFPLPLEGFHIFKLEQYEWDFLKHIICPTLINDMQSMSRLSDAFDSQDPKSSY